MSFPSSSRMHLGRHSNVHLGRHNSNELHDNAVLDVIKLILLNYNNFSIAKIVVKKIERVK